MCFVLHPLSHGASWRTFDFLGYTFRPRMAVGGHGELFTSFCPAVRNDAAKAIRRQIKRWRLHLRSGHTLSDLAREINPIVRGWLAYYGRFYRSWLIQSLRRIDDSSSDWRCGNTNGCAANSAGRGT
jgi:RNA-directed DNA polymerase